MNIYTRNGDRGTTSLMNGISVSKSDDRIELVGTIDELNSFIGLAKVLADASLKESLSHIQRNLMQIMAGVADPRNMDYRFSADETKALEEEIDRIENSFPRIKDFVLYGGCELSARLDVARSVTRRAERRFRKVEQNYGQFSTLTACPTISICAHGMQITGWRTKKRTGYRIRL